MNRAVTLTSRFDIKAKEHTKPVGIAFRPAEYSENLDITNPWKSLRYELAPRLFLLFDSENITYKVPSPIDEEKALGVCLTCPIRHNLSCPGPVHNLHRNSICRRNLKLENNYNEVSARLPAHAITVGPVSDPAIYAIHPETVNNVALFRPLPLGCTDRRGIFIWRRFITEHNNTMNAAYRQSYDYGGTRFIELTKTLPHSHESRGGFDRTVQVNNYPDYLARLDSICIEQYSLPPTGSAEAAVLDSNHCLLFSATSTFHTAYISQHRDFADPLDPSSTHRESTLFLEDDNGIYSVYSRKYIPNDLLLHRNF